MDGIVLIDKEKNVTSRDVCNKLSKILNTKRLGHTGTLDPIATGLLIICVNEGCKLQEELTGHDKDYIAKVKVGIKTDTYDITGNIIEKNDNYHLTKEELIKTLNSFIPGYNQKVPKYSAIKVNGKKLYEYARNNISVDIPEHNVKINKIELLDFQQDNFTFFVSVSSGTYIRSLINDIGEKLGIPMTMEELERTRIGKFKLEDAQTIENLKIIPILDVLDIDKLIIENDDLYKKIKNGVQIKNIYNKEKILFIKDNTPLAIYKDDNNILKPYRVFNVK